jgi:hypothetical protein
MTLLSRMKSRTFHSIPPEVKAGKHHNSISEGGPALALASAGLWLVLAFQKTVIKRSPVDADYGASLVSFPGFPVSVRCSKAERA